MSSKIQFADDGRHELPGRFFTVLAIFLATFAMAKPGFAQDKSDDILLVSVGESSSL